MSSYERGHRRYPNVGRDRESDRDRSFHRDRRDDSRDNHRKRPRDDSSGPSRRGKFQNRGGCGRGARGNRGGRGGRVERPEFFDLLTTRPKELTNKQGEATKNDEKLQLCANYFKVSSENKFSMKMFKVQFEPYIKDWKVKSKLMNILSRSLDGACTHDGNDTFFVMNDPPLRKEVTVTYSGQSSTYSAIFKYCREINYTKAEFLQIFNLVARQSMKDMGLELIGRNHYDPNKKIEIFKEKLQIWPGFATAIRKHEQDLLLCCDISHKIIRQETVLHVLQEIRHEARDNERDYRRAAVNAFKGKTVMTSYNNKTFKIHDINFDLNPTSTFKNIGTGTDKQYIEYYYERYKISIRDLKQPLLVHNPKAKDIRGGKTQKTLLIPELCFPVGHTDRMRNDTRLMRDLQEKTRTTPEERVKRLLEYVNRLTINGSKPLKENKLEIETKLVEFEGRKLPDQKIFFGKSENNKPQVVDLRNAKIPADWTSDLKNVVLLKPVAVIRWVYMYPQSIESKAKRFLEEFRKAGTKLGMDMSKNPLEISLKNANIGEYENKIAEFKQKDCNFFMFITLTRKSDYYKEIKKSCAQSYPVASQVVTARVMEKGMSAATKIAVQVNCKLGGIPWIVDIPIDGFMTIGFSITKNCPDRKSIFGAMVASMKPGDPSGSYFSCVDYHDRGSNISDHFGLNIIKSVNEYLKRYNSLPEHIIIYRDGVGDGQLRNVLELEVEDVNSRLKKLYENYGKRPKLAFIIINKKINTRIFEKNSRNYLNPPPGTVVDNVITHPEKYDFYLISQSVSQGTVSPTSYNIVHDTVNMKTKDIQLVTYKLCHMYYNWSGTVRVPSVVQYASKLASLFGEHLCLGMSENFQNLPADRQLYFL